MHYLLIKISRRWDILKTKVLFKNSNCRFPHCMESPMPTPSYWWHFLGLMPHLQWRAEPTHTACFALSFALGFSFETSGVYLTQACPKIRSSYLPLHPWAGVLLIKSPSLWTPHKGSFTLAQKSSVGWAPSTYSNRLVMHSSSVLRFTLISFTSTSWDPLLKSLY